jgi:hypothetical protein
VLEEGATTCCYASSEKAWITDPQGLAWETFLTSGESTVYGDSADLGAIRVAMPAACCVAGMTQDTRGTSAPAAASDAPCCSTRAG